MHADVCTLFAPGNTSLVTIPSNALCFSIVRASFRPFVSVATSCASTHRAERAACKHYHQRYTDTEGTTCSYDTCMYVVSTGACITCAKHQHLFTSASCQKLLNSTALKHELSSAVYHNIMISVETSTHSDHF
jgi:hypothetical protein